MAPGKQAKTLSRAQADAVLGYIASTRYPDRNRVIFLKPHASRLHKHGCKAQGGTE